MISHLWQYFGILGTLSIIGWGVALLLLGVFCRQRSRTRFWFYALIIAIATYGLAKLNSRNINAFQVERTPEEMAAKAEESADPADKKPQLRFAEDAPTDKLDLAGKKAVDDSEPEYRKQGKQTRIRPTNTTVVSLGEKPKVETVAVRKLSETDVYAANQYDHINLMLTRFTFWLALGLVLFDYFSRVNKTCDHLLPLPLAGRTLDAVYPKSHTVLIRKNDDTTIRRYLENTVRRGENFIYYGPADPLPDSTLPRLPVGKWSLGKLTKLVLGPGQKPFDPDFVNESAWFSRYCFVIVGDEPCMNMLAALYKFLETRHITRAYAWRTVHVVWNCEFPIPPEDFKMFAYLCRTANYKLVVFSKAPPEATTAPLFEEVIAG